MYDPHILREITKTNRLLERLIAAVDRLAEEPEIEVCAPSTVGARNGTLTQQIINARTNLDVP